MEKTIESDIDTNLQNDELDTLSIKTKYELDNFKESVSNLQTRDFPYLRDSTDGKYKIYSYVVKNGETADEVREAVWKLGLANSRADVEITDVNNNKYAGLKNLPTGEKVYVRVLKESQNDNDNIGISKIGESKDGFYTIYRYKLSEDCTSEKIKNEFMTMGLSPVKITDRGGREYPKGYKFYKGEKVYIKVFILPKDENSHTNLNDAVKDKEDKLGNPESSESSYKNMIENQTKPIDNDPTKTEIAITIDDGYNPGKQLERMLDVLDKKGIKATFFTLGECIARDKSNVWKNEVLGRGHQICCHTYSHAYIEDAETTNLFSGHGISPSRTPELVKQREGYVKNILGQSEYDKIKKESGPGFPQKVKTTALLDAEIRMWEKQVEKSFGKDYLIKMKRDFPFFRFPGKVGAYRSENIAILKKHGYLSIGRTHESGKDKGNIKGGGIELFHVNENIAKNFEKYLDNLGIQGTQVTDIVTP